MFNWTPGRGWKDPMDLGLPVLRTCICPEVSLELTTSFFLSMLFGVHMALCLTEPDFSGKISFELKLTKITPK